MIQTPDITVSRVIGDNLLHRMQRCSNIPALHFQGAGILESPKMTDAPVDRAPRHFEGCENVYLMNDDHALFTGGRSARVHQHGRYPR